jgi:hypothetical protein
VRQAAHRLDEVHHLPAPTYRAIAEKAAAPWRLGLSATPERSDGGHDDLAMLIGPEVYRRRPADLAEEGHIAQYREKRIYVDLTAEERARYDLLMAEWRWYLASKRSVLGRGGLFEQLIRQSAHDPAARRALQAQRQARRAGLGERRPRRVVGGAELIGAGMLVVEDRQREDARVVEERGGGGVGGDDESLDRVARVEAADAVEEEAPDAFGIYAISAAGRTGLDTLLAAWWSRLLGMRTAVQRAHDELALP